MNQEIDAMRRLVAAFGGAEPLPAGGAAAVVALAMGAALGAKVLSISAGPGCAEAEARLRALVEEVVPEFEADCAAFEAVLTALRLPRDDETRAASIERAWTTAAAAPVAVARLAHAVEASLTGVADAIKSSVASDFTASLELVRAAGRIAAQNARENAARLAPDASRSILQSIDDLGADGAPDHE